jgi:c-di-GMP-binding flagellar brake protein YcgR
MTNKKGADPAEKRAYQRLGVYHIAKYKPVDGSKDSAPVIAAVKNVSGGGVCLVVNGNVPVSSVIQLYINFPKLNVPIVSVAKVVWAHKIGKGKYYELGIRFLEIDRIFQQAIVDRIKKVCDIAGKA